MAIQRITNSLLYGLSTDTKPSNYATNTVWNEIDTGNIYTYNGASWVLFSGASKTETLTNKTLTTPVISSISNTGTLTLPTTTDTIVGRATTDTLTNKTIADTSNTLSLTPTSYPFYTIPNNASIASSVGFCLADNTALTTFGILARQANTGTLTLKNDLLATEGLYVNYNTTTSTNTRCGAFNNVATHTVTMDMNPVMAFRVRFPTVSNLRVYMGLKQDTGITTTDTLVSTSVPTVMAGFRTSDTNMQLVTCNGSTVTYKNSTQALTANQWHTWGISMTSGGTASILYDGAVLTTTATTTPTTGQAMSPCLLITNSTTTAESVDIHYYTLVKDF